MIGAALGWITGGSATRLTATLLAGAVAASVATWRVQEWRHTHLQARRAEEQARELLRQVERRDAATADHTAKEDHAEQIHTQIIERVRVINARPGGAVQCLDADGLRELGHAIDNGAPAAPAAGTGPALPAAGQAR